VRGTAREATLIASCRDAEHVTHRSVRDVFAHSRCRVLRARYRGASSSGSTENVCDGPIGVKVESTSLPIAAR
jgi:hypothetical protein